MKNETMENLGVQGTGEDNTNTAGIPRGRALSVKIDNFDISNNLV